MPAAPPTPSPDSPSGCASAPAGRPSCANSPTRPPSPRPAPRPAWNGPAPPTRTAAPPSAPPTTPAAPPARCAPSAPRSPAPPTTSPRADASAPKTSLPALREAYRAASQLYEKVGVGADLRAEQARAESDESAALADLDRLTNKVRTRAAQLLRRPRRRRRPLPAGRRRPRRVAGADAGDPCVRRERAARPAARRGRAARPRRRRAPTPSCPRSWCPRDAEHAQALLRTATAELAARTDALDDGPRRPRRAAARPPRRRGRGRRLRRDRRPAPRPAARPQAARRRSGEEPPEPYPGTPRGGPAVRRRGPPLAARLRRRPVRRRAVGARGERRPRTARQLHPLRAGPHPRPAADPRTARRRAARARRRRGRTPSRPGCASSPTSWSSWSATATRIVDRLRGLVESSLATLRSAQRLSRLPGGAGGVVRAGVPADPLRGARPGHAHRAARRGHRRGDPRRRQEELRPAPGRHVPAAAGSQRRAAAARASPWRSSSRTRCCAPSGCRSGRWATSSPAASC